MEVKVMDVKKIYFDMDGVLANFDRGVVELAKTKPQDQLRTTQEEDKILWDAIRKVDHFYDKLELMDNAKELFDLVYNKYQDKCEILTGIPKPHKNILNAGVDKISWMHRKLSKDIIVNIVYKEQKKDFCTGPDCILIDDLETNIKSWVEMGGTGILFHNAKDTISELKKINIL